MPEVNYTRILELIVKRLRDTITPPEFDELNQWIYADTGNNRDTYGIFINPDMAQALSEVVDALNASPK